MAQADQIKAKIRKLHADIAQRKDRIDSLRKKDVDMSMEAILKDVLETTPAAVKNFRPAPPLASFIGQKVHIYPKEQGFEKTVQTDDSMLTSPSPETPPQLERSPQPQRSLVTSMPLRRGLWNGVQAIAALTTKTLPAKIPEPEEAKVATEMSAEDRERILADAQFLSFFDHTSKLVERCLGQKCDPLQDYRGERVETDSGCEQKLTETCVFADDKYTAGRPISDVRFSPNFPELMLASYVQKENPSLQDEDGLMLVWSCGLRTRPEHVFTSNSPVLTAIFDKFNPALYVGGTYSGAILMWDARVKKSPVQRSHLSAKAHSHPVYSMQQVGTKNATNVITASTDGRLCIWSLNMLSSPQEYVELKKGSHDLCATALSFPEDETNMLYVGAEDGSISQVHVHGTKSTPVSDSLDGHDGPVTAVDFHPQPDGGASLYSSLLLSCSVDWSVKLWHTKKSSHTIMNFDGIEDYVCDVKWHPLFPSVFASVDAEGTVCLWNLNKDLEAPVFRTASKKTAYNRCDWSNDGHHFATGDTSGHLQLWTCDKSFWYPKADDFSTFEARMEGLDPAVSEKTSRSRDI